MTASLRVLLLVYCVVALLGFHVAVLLGFCALASENIPRRWCELSVFLFLDLF